MNVTRRPSVEGDLEWARTVHHAAVRAVVERQFGAWNELEQDRFFDRDWSGGDFEVIELDGERCGYVCIESRSDVVFVRELDVAPEFQRRGIGTFIMAGAIDTARDRGVPVVLETLHENEAANLYRRLGFVETGRTDTHIQFRLDP